MQDIQNAYSIPLEELGKLYPTISFINHFNSGLRCFWRKSMNLKDMDNFIKYLEKCGANSKLWRDQTYAMVSASKNYKKAHKYSTKKYLLSLSPEILQSTICCHYISPIRYRLFSDAFLLLRNRSK